jgi:hypothetical protein
MLLASQIGLTFPRRGQCSYNTAGQCVVVGSETFTDGNERDCRLSVIVVCIVYYSNCMYVLLVMERFLIVPSC